MNLALLDPFRRQIPDRIDSTLTLPRNFHPRRRSLTNSSSSPKHVLTLDKVTETKEGLTSTKVTSELISDEDVSMEYPLSDEEVSPGTLTSAATATAAGEHDAPLQQSSSFSSFLIPTSCHAVSFNRRGTYLAAGHASGALPVHEFASRTLSSIHYPARLDTHSHSNNNSNTGTRKDGTLTLKKKQDPPIHDEASPTTTKPPPSEESTTAASLPPLPSSSTSPPPTTTKQQQQQQQPLLFHQGITSVTWSRRSRQMLSSSMGDAHVCLVDNTHPLGPSEVGLRKCRKSVGRGGSVAMSERNNKGGGTTATEQPQHSQDRSRSTTPVPGEEGGGDNHEEGGKGEDGSPLSSKMNGLDSLTVGISPVGENWKRARVISNLQILNPDLITADIVKNSIENKRSMDLDQPTTSTWELTSQEKRIDTKPSENRTMEERRIHVELQEEEEEPMNTDNNSTTMANRKLFPSINRYQTLIMKLPQPITGTVQIHPEGNGGLACLEDGSLVLFSFPRDSFLEPCALGSSTAQEEESNRSNTGKVVYLTTGQEHSIACASFAKRGQVVYAATKKGKLLGFDVPSLLSDALFNTSYPLDSSIGRILETSKVILKDETIMPLGESFHAKIPGGAVSNHLVSSHNGKMILVNSQDCSLRLYGTNEIWKESSKKDKGSAIDLKPRFMFQDAVSKHQWACCDFSGDGEYVVGGCNNQETGDTYELYLWNTATGVLLDQLTGPQVSLHSLSWHPTRSFIAVGTSDGVIDIWGPRMDWTAFAPDFQALQKNVEYIEREDEFDIVIDGDEDEEVKRKERNDKLEEQEIVDIINVESVPAFDSDSEDEESVFYFDIKIRGHSTFARRGKM